jgi:PAS domain-containing protein
MFPPGWTERANAALETILHVLSVYCVPAAIAAMSLVALSTFDPQYNASGGNPIEIRAYEQTSDAPEPALALANLAKQPLVSYFDTQLSGSPFWFSFTAQPTQGDGQTAIELPSRHALTTSCWGAKGQHPLGSATRKGSTGEMRLGKTGFVLDLGELQAAQTVLCKAVFAGPGRISVLQWPAAEFDISNQKFHRDSGLVDGGLILLSLFVLLTAIINREWSYVLFAVWLMTNLRLAALSAGWDMQWLERTIPPEWILLTRSLTIAAYYTLTVTLFSTIFREDLKRVGHLQLLRLTQWSCLPLLILGAVLPYAVFLPYMWVSTALSIAVLVFYIVRILFATRSKVAMWYSASLGIALFASFYEVIAAAVGLKGLIGAVNFVTAALASSLMAALAIAEQMRQERLGRVKAQAELRSTYEAIPIGLFTLDANGVFLRGNPALRRMLGVDMSRAKK